jgi:hypothetical protein
LTQARSSAPLLARLSTSLTETRAIRLIGTFTYTTRDGCDETLLNIGELPPAYKQQLQIVLCAAASAKLHRPKPVVCEISGVLRRARQKIADCCLG